MGKKITGAQRPFTMLIANLKQGSDPSLGTVGNPVKMRSTCTFQLCPEIAGRGPVTDSAGLSTLRGNITYPSSGGPVASSGKVTVATVAFAGPTTLILGQYRLTTDEDFVVDASTSTTATNLAAAIDALPGYTGSASTDDVNITGPVGPDGNEIAFKMDGISPYNFTLDPPEGHLEGAEPVIGPFVFT
jgi:hypothetical protein